MELIMRIASALRPAHALQYVHRDLHPGNIVVDDSAYSYERWEELDGTTPGVKILDFGVHANALTKMLWPEDPAAETFRPVGSVKHASPEALATPARVKPSSDMWSIGVIFYRFLTGKMPFFGETLMDLVKITTAGNYKEPDSIQGATESEMKVILAVLRNLLNPDSDARLGAGDLIKIAQDTLFQNLAGVCESSREFANFYFKYSGDIWMCPECKQVVHPFGSRCSVCGRHQEEWLHWSTRV
jgi:serine/threonine protein kinase